LAGLQVGPTVQARTLRWLLAHDFCQRARVAPDHVRFAVRCKKRIHCGQLGLARFVDEHPEVVAAICRTVDYQYFFGPQREPVPDYGVSAASWADLEVLITNSLG
jgi:hypothetical protein